MHALTLDDASNDAARGPSAQAVRAPSEAAHPLQNTAACLLNLINDRAAFDALEGEWNDLFERAGPNTTVFQSFNWLWHWCNHFLDESLSRRSGARLAIVTGRRSGRLVMAWPLLLERVGGVMKLVWMGDPVSQYGDVLVEPGPDQRALLEAAWSFVLSDCGADIIRLRKVRADAAVAPLLAAKGALKSEVLEAPYLDLKSAPTFEAYEQRYSGKARKNRRRLMRRLEEQGPVAIERLTGGDRAAAVTREAMDMKRAWLAARGRVSHALADPRFDAFFADVTASRCHGVGSRVSVLSSNGETAAVEIAFRAGGHLAVHVIVYNLNYEKSGAGALLMEDSIRCSHQDSIECFDLLAPGDDYKMDWADGKIEVVDWAQPLTIRGQAYARLYLGLVRATLKQAMTAIPGTFRHVLSSTL